VFSDREKFKALTGVQIAEDPAPLSKIDENKSTDLVEAKTDAELAISQSLNLEEVKEDSAAMQSQPEEPVLTQVVERAFPEVPAEEAKELGTVQPALTESHPTESIKINEEADKAEVVKQPIESFDEVMKDAPKLESSSLVVSKDVPAATAGSNSLFGQIKGQDEYIDDLQKAIKESIRNMSEASESLVQKFSSELDVEELKTTDPIKDVEGETVIDTMNKKKFNSRKLKKMFFKKAIQNLDDNFEGLEDICNVEQDELEKIRSIIANKKAMQKTQADQDTRKYSRDYIGTNSTPIYKNILSISKTLLKSFDHNLNNQFSKNTNILEKLTNLSNTFLEDSKS